ncbi:MULTISPECIES: MarR family winged helix-turn-helix transcriptional regulator [unclassified Agrococcus]|uniref:MarR family winged helix-turn-helix transcriptional regulator n=1 Tax=unclassified Agrococcus TaxID=2615065 RepID=UPI00361870F1
MDETPRRQHVLHPVAEAVERLRLAEARLERRRESSAEPSPIERAALRFVFERADNDDPATPSELGEFIGLSRSAITALVARFLAEGLVTVRPHPVDGRSKILLPVDRNDHLDGDDDLTDDIRRMADELSQHDADTVVAFLERLCELVDLRTQRLADGQQDRAS